MAAITLGSVTLPGDLKWSDEFAWTPVSRSLDYGLTGALIPQEWVKLASRPITLKAQSGDMGYVWLKRVTVLALQSLANTPGWSGTLTLSDGRTFPVAFRENGHVATPVIHQNGGPDTLPYVVTIQLQTV